MKNQMPSVIHVDSSNQSCGRLTRRLSLCIICAAASVALLPITHAVSPPPDGGYANQNTAAGDCASSNSQRIGNTAVGNSALEIITTANDNTAVGWGALNANTGSFNTAVGMFALVNNTTGNNNTAIGQDALANNSAAAGHDNTAVGQGALVSNTTGGLNTAIGSSALANNTTGAWNTANGVECIYFNTTGYQDTADGYLALYSNTSGHDNTAAGYQALGGNTTGSNNIAVGSNAGANLTRGNNNIDIGASVTGTAGEANTIRIGKSGTQQKAFIAGIFGKTVANGAGVMINSNGQLGTVQSSARFKENIKPMEKASEAVLKLKPVTFRYKQELDPGKIPQFGLIAEEVEKTDPDLVVRDEEGKVTTVRYEAVNAMLLNEFLKEHCKVREQQRELDQLRKTVAAQQNEFRATITQQRKQIESLTATVQQVSDRLELNNPTPQLVANER